MKIIYLIFLFLIATASSGKTVKDKSKNEAKEFVLGYIENVHSQILNEDRILNIYLPEDYNKDTKYPVIYLLDGSADEDFIHVVGIVQYNTFAWVDRIPKSIVVGIANTNRKKNFTSPSNREIDKRLIPDNGGSEQFISFIEKELQPYIETKYKTTEDKTIIGQSLGGLLATEILFTKPQLFNKYIIISPSLWWKDGYLLNSQPSILNKDYTTPTDVYIGVGKEGSINGSKNHIMENDARLLADKIKEGQCPNIKVYFDYLPEENHATVTHQSVFNAFRLLYPTEVSKEK